MSKPTYELCAIAIDDLVVRNGHNPRTTFDEADHNRLVAAIQDRGFRHPIEVTPADEDGRFAIVDGERRFRAAKAAGLEAIPALIKPADTDDSGGDLVDAILANDLGVKLDVVDEAKAYERLLKHGGLTRRGVAEACEVPIERVRERLAILQLPVAVQQQIASGDVPLRAVRSLVALAKIDAGLPALAIRRVREAPTQRWARQATWLDLEHDAVEVAVGRVPGEHAELPEGVFAADSAYPATAFALSEQAVEDAAELRELLDIAMPDDLVVRFNQALVEQAAALGAAHSVREHGVSVIVGADVAAQLAGDYLARCVRVQREAAQHRPPTTPTPASTEEERQEAAKREREDQQRARKAAELRNDLLGRAIVKHLSRVKVDERVLKVLTAAPLSRDLRSIATRGARYGFPGWVSTQRATSGRTKSTYLAPTLAEPKAREYLAGASAAPDIAGRSLALLAMARWADEGAVAQSNRSFYSLRLGGYGAGEHGVPWRTEAEALLDEILLERLPADVAEPIREALTARAAEAERQAEAERKRLTEQNEGTADEPVVEQAA